MTSKALQADRREVGDPTARVRPRRRDSDLADAATVGTAVHRLIAHLATLQGSQAPDVPTMRRVGKPLVGSMRAAPSQRQALRAGALSLAGVYVTRFWPARARLVAACAVLGESECDLIWLLPGGDLQIDELKTGMFATAEHRPIIEQARRQLADATRVLGGRPAVRVVFLRRQQALVIPEDRSRGDAGHGC